MKSIYKDVNSYLDEYMADFTKETNKIVMNFLAKLKMDRENKLREKLIDSGWTPPSGKGEIMNKATKKRFEKLEKKFNNHKHLHGMGELIGKPKQRVFYCTCVPAYIRRVVDILNIPPPVSSIGILDWAIEALGKYCERNCQAKYLDWDIQKMGGSYYVWIDGDFIDKYTSKSLSGIICKSIISHHERSK